MRRLALAIAVIGLAAPAAAHAQVPPLRAKVTTCSSGPFDVLLSGAGPDQPPQRIPGLAAGAQTTVVFAAPRCAPGSTLRITVDARGEIAEASEADDAAERTCPLAA